VSLSTFTAGTAVAYDSSNAQAVFGAPGVTVREVAWHHVAAVALRETLAAELLCSGRPLSLEGGGEVAYTGVAFTPEGMPVGHAALRWNDDDDIELQRVYVTPPYRCLATATALVTAAEQAAHALDARRILLRPGDQQPGDVRFWESAGYVRGSPLDPRCLEKVIIDEGYDHGLAAGSRRTLRW
jgi:GNAT superfamily N-acetyltransferase